jgi:serine/threonine protein kinase/WD40 repeat protein
MSASSADRDPLDQLAEEFVARLRAGQRPALTEYAEKHPELADQIRELFPALVEMEYLKPATGEHTGAFTPAAEPCDPIRVGEFRILRRVGHGGMGVVYEAVQESLGRHVALKLLPAETVADPKRRERFRREASAAARLHHTNIVPVFGVGEADGRHFYAMQFISGHPLDAVIDEVKRLKEHAREQPTAPREPAVPREVSKVAAALLSGTFTRSAPPVAPGEGAAGDTTRTHRGGSAPASAPPAAPADSAPALSGSISEGGRSYWTTVARIGAQVADALAYAHAQGVLHRDVKPANLLLDLRGTVWVTDFGLAKATDADDLTQVGDVVGTLRYMAPERFDGHGDARADVYALGLTLYELLTLQPAFRAENRAKLVEQVIAASPPKPRSVNPAIPKDLETVVLKAIARDPAMRYQSATELSEDLHRFLEDRPIRARRASSAEQAFRWCRRNPAVASLLTAVLVVFAAGAAVAGFFAIGAEAQRERAEDREREANDERNRANDALKLADAEAEKVRAKELFTRRLLYYSQMNHASVALTEGRLDRVREILDETTPKPGEPDLRGWEWHYLDRLLRGEYRTVTLERIHPEATSLLTSRPGGGGLAQMDGNPFPLSGNGRRVLGYHRDGEGYRFDVWDTLTGRLINPLPLTGQPAIVGRPVRSPAGNLDIGRPVGILSPDGGYLGAWEERNTDKPENPSGRMRIWNVDTGQELTAPEIGSAQFLSITISAGGVWWLKSASPPAREGSGPKRPGTAQEPKKTGEKAETGGNLREAPPSESARPPEYVAHSWDRASGQVTTQRFRPGDGTDTISTRLSGASQDGRILVFRLNRPDPLNRSWEAQPALPLECWDLATTPPRRVWSAPPPSAPGWTVSTHVSPGGKMVAVRDETGVTVYRTEGRAGEPVVEWRSELPAQNPPFNGWTVFDDGRLVFQLSYGLAFVSPDRLRLNRDYDDLVSTRQRVLYTREFHSGLFRDFSGPVQLVDDGKTLVALGDGGVRVWRLDDAPTPLSELQVIATSPDGRLRVEQIPIARDQGGGRPTTPPRPDVAPRPRIVPEDLLVKDAATDRILLRIPVPAGTRDSWCHFAAGSKRLLVQFQIPNSEARPWVLYDVDGGHLVAEGKLPRSGGPGFAGLATSPAGRWFIQGGRTDSELIVRDALTGQVACEFHAPDGAAVGAYQFDPSAGRLAITTVPKSLAVSWVKGPQGGWTAAKPPPPGPFDIHLLDPATGKTVWVRKAVDVCGSSLFHLFFNPSGRLLVGYFDSKQTFQVWVGRAATGDFERTLTAAAASDGSRRTGLTRWVVTDRDERRVAVVDGGEVRVWDLDAGRLVATVAHDTPLSAVALSPDGTRLFTLNAVPRVAERGRVRISVWDLATARLAFTIQPPDPVLMNRIDRASGVSTNSPGILEFQDGKLSVVQRPLSCTFDGTPVKP